VQSVCSLINKVALKCVLSPLEIKLMWPSIAERANGKTFFKAQKNEKK